MICNQKNWSLKEMLIGQILKEVLIAVNGREKIISEDILQLAPHIKICAVNTNNQNL